TVKLADINDDGSGLPTLVHVTAKDPLLKPDGGAAHPVNNVYVDVTRRPSASDPTLAGTIHAAQSDEFELSNDNCYSPVCPEQELLAIDMEDDGSFTLEVRVRDYYNFVLFYKGHEVGYF